ncbi:conserved Plasmodium protein, unknown function [Plasmodium gallinaceum]|uniref:Uncharacterized protein n=1 Tax=Plasmodium gallinaceum TaxID=5849 RepID=A0A1J1GZC4_PLAGA|nr:conserved Plasmodium protein, unknown function [Plasmodium gallinaceum]CRG97918.1 conserved Plasmodium protein, unknown function [Plasmodium gallinaceum]
MDKETFLLNEQIKFDKFNENVEEEYKRKFNSDSKIDGYFEDDASSNLMLREKKKKEKIFLYNFISPFIDLGKHFYSSLKLIYEPKLYHLSIFLTMLWGYKNIKCINKLLFYKYNDIYYQITRPDSLNSRNKAFKTLVIGGLVIPCSFVAFSIYDMSKEKKNSLFIKNFEKPLSEKKTIIIPYNLRRNISKKVLSLKEKTLFFAKDLAENNNFKRLSKEYHKNINKRLNKNYLKKDELD